MAVPQPEGTSRGGAAKKSGNASSDFSKIFAIFISAPGSKEQKEKGEPVAESSPPAAIAGLSVDSKAKCNNTQSYDFSSIISHGPRNPYDFR
jgi:hypothetical protein